MQNQHFWTVVHRCGLHTFLRTTFLAFVVIVEAFFLLELEVLLRAVGVDILILLVLEFPFYFAVFADYFDIVFGPECLLKHFFAASRPLQLFL